jgi:outer membrane protein TolC
MFAFFGCTKVGPDFKKPDILPQLKIDTNETNKELSTWWDIFHDKTLNTLIKKAYEQNIDIQQAGLRILQARVSLGYVDGYRYPQKQTLSGAAMQSYKNSNSISALGVGFDMGWEVDFWGKYAREIESAEAGVYLSVSSYRDIMSTVAAEVARNYINYKMAQERIVYAKRNIIIQERVAKMTEVQFNSGNVSELDMQQARTQLYTTRAKLPSIELSKLNYINTIALLLGTTKEEIQKILNDDFKDKVQEYIKNPLQTNIELKEDKNNTLGVSIVPSVNFDITKNIDISLIKRRPDVKVAEYKARIQSAKIGSTKALLYPSFILIGNIGINATDAGGSWTKFENIPTISAGPAFSWNIFQYGRIKNKIRLQDAIFEESMLNYNKTVLKALNEVSNAIDGYIYTKRQLQENQKALKATIRAFNLSAKQYNEGFVSYQRLLSTVEKLTTTHDIYAQIKALVAIDAILLYKSLGGGWQYSNNKKYISDSMKEKLKNSDIDWGEYLKNVQFQDN